jgi:hypothetical protein
MRRLDGGFVLVLAVMQCSCAGSESIPVEDPSVAAAYDPTIVARTHPNAPRGFDVEPGDLVAGAKVVITGSAASDLAKYVSTTDESGRAIMKVANGAYRITVEKGTHDPYCDWFDGADVEIANGPAERVLGQICLLCE